MNYIRIFVKFKEGELPKQKNAKMMEITRYLDSIGADFEAEFTFENFKESNRRRLLDSVEMYEKLRDIVPGWNKSN